ncbi:hypothetical protein B0H12DRAFT_819606 [Mycena haematopus]|nr:hypothetical protein B0H12DRAFT_819606 [Mycena haematopus]
MDKLTARTRPLPHVRFRVLVAGRANAGKTSILQRVCETTESPAIHRVKIVDDEEIREEIDYLDPTLEVGTTSDLFVDLNVTRMQRGEHDVSDELTFSNHTGYVFHDSCGFECGAKEELQIVQDFIRERLRRRKFEDRVHAIWYCIPMDSERPGLDIAPFHNICSDRNVPMIPVFTKYDAFKFEVRMRLEDDEHLQGDQLQEQMLRQSEEDFNEHYLKELCGVSRFVRLEGMDQPDARCNELITTTMDGLNDDVVTMMLLAVQRGNLELNVRRAVDRCLDGSSGTGDATVKECLRAFPIFWWVSPPPRPVAAVPLT